MGSEIFTIVADIINSGVNPLVKICYPRWEAKRQDRNRTEVQPPYGNCPPALGTNEGGKVASG